MDRYEDLVRCAPDPILVFDRQGRLREANPATATLLGRPLPAIFGQHFRQLRELRPLSRRRIVAGVRNLLQSGEAPALELELRRADGAIAIVEAKQRLVRHASGADEVEVIIRDVTARRRAEEARAMASELREARERERAVVARRLHDDLAQPMTAIGLGLGLISSHSALADPALTEQIRHLRTVVEKSISTLRQIISEIRPSVLDDFGLAAAVGWQARDFAGRTGVACTADVELDDDSCPPELAVGVFRLLQDLLNSVFAHAGSSRVRVLLRREGSRLCLSAEGDGPGSRAAETGRSSEDLSRLREHARWLGGELEIEPMRPSGTIVRIRVPFKAFS